MTRTRTVSRSPSATVTVTLVVATRTRSFGPRNVTATRTATASISRSRAPPLPTPVPTPKPPTTPRPPSPPKVTTTTAAPTMPPTLAPGDFGPRPPKVTHIPGQPEPTIWGAVEGRITVDALRTGRPVESRVLLIKVFNAYYDVDKCRLPNRLLFNVPGRGLGDVSWLDSHTVWCNYTHMTVAFATSQTVAIGDDVYLGIWLHRAMLYNQSVYVEFPVMAPAVPAGVEQAQTTAAAATVAVSVVGGGPSGATEIQGLGLLGMMSCAEPKLKSSMRGARKAIAPLQLGNDEIGFLAGNLVIVTGVVAGVGLITAAAFAKFRHDEMSGKEREDEEYEDPTEPESDKTPIMRALSLVGSPGLIYTIVVLGHQGIALESFMLLHDPDVSAGSKAFAAFGVIYSVALPALFAWRLKTTFRGVMATYRYVHQGVPLPLRIIMPGQFWLPINYANRHGTAFKTLKDVDLYFSAWEPLGRITLISFIAAFHASQGPACQAQYGSIAAVYALEAMYRIVRWPHLTPIGNIGPLAAALTTALISSSQGFGFEVLSVDVAMVLQSYLSMTCAGLKVIITLVDEKIWQKREVKNRYLRNDFDWGPLDCAIDEDAKKLLETDKKDSDGDKDGESDDNGTGDGGEKPSPPSGSNPLLNLPERTSRMQSKAAAAAAKAEVVPDTSGTLAALLAMKAEGNAAVKVGKPVRAKAQKKKGRRPDDSDDEHATSSDDDL